MSSRNKQRDVALAARDTSAVPRTGSLRAMLTSGGFLLGLVCIVAAVVLLLVRRVRRVEAEIVRLNERASRLADVHRTLTENVRACVTDNQLHEAVRLALAEAPMTVGGDAIADSLTKDDALASGGQVSVDTAGTRPVRPVSTPVNIQSHVGTALQSPAPAAPVSDASVRTRKAIASAVVDRARDLHNRGNARVNPKLDDAHKDIHGDEPTPFTLSRSDPKTTTNEAQGHPILPRKPTAAATRVSHRAETGHHNITPPLQQLSPENQRSKPLPSARMVSRPGGALGHELSPPPADAQVLPARGRQSLARALARSSTSAVFTPARIDHRDIMPVPSTATRRGHYEPQPMDLPSALALPSGRGLVTAATPLRSLVEDVHAALDPASDILVDALSNVAGMVDVARQGVAVFDAMGAAYPLLDMAHDVMSGGASRASSMFASSRTLTERTRAGLSVRFCLSPSQRENNDDADSDNDGDNNGKRNGSSKSSCHKRSFEHQSGDEYDDNDDNDDDNEDAHPGALVFAASISAAPFAFLSGERQQPHDNYPGRGVPACPAAFRARIETLSSDDDEDAYTDAERRHAKLSPPSVKSACFDSETNMFATRLAQGNADEHVKSFPFAQELIPTGEPSFPENNNDYQLASFEQTFDDPDNGTAARESRHEDEKGNGNVDKDALHIASHEPSADMPRNVRPTVVDDLTEVSEAADERMGAEQCDAPVSDAGGTSNLTLINAIRDSRSVGAEAALATLLVDEINEADESDNLAPGICSEPCSPEMRTVLHNVMASDDDNDDNDNGIVPAGEPLVDGDTHVGGGETDTKSDARAGCAINAANEVASPTIMPTKTTEPDGAIGSAIGMNPLDV